jgi:hypothetical protein
LAHVRFVNRSAELAALMGLAERGTGVPLYIYGPEGCGKTRLLREFVARLAGRDGFLAVYIDALEEADASRAVAGSQELLDVLLKAVEKLHGPIGVLLAYAIVRVLARMEASRIRGKHVVVVVDDVARPIGLDSIEAYMKNLLKLVEYELPEKEPSSILVVASTSEGLSVKRLRRHPTWSSIRLLWNLPREGFEQLASLLNPPNARAVEEAWRLTGGNPRALIEIATAYNWNTSLWLREVEANIAIPLFAEIRARGLERALYKLVEDVDAIVKEPSNELLELARLLEENNVIIYKASPTLDGSTLAAGAELGIGRLYAWQLPAYRLAFKRSLQEGT